MGVKDALMKYSQKELTKIKRQQCQGRKNKSPERDTEKEIKKWAEENGVDLTKVNSKTTYSEGGHYFNKPVDEFGFSDFVGNHGEVAVYVEAKARGKRSAASGKQIEFLTRKIMAGCFACVSDGSEHLNNLFYRCKGRSKNERIRLLLADLPKKKKQYINDEALFPEED